VSQPPNLRIITADTLDSKVVEKISDPTSEVAGALTATIATGVASAAGVTVAPIADGNEALVAKLDQAEPLTVAAFGDSTFAGRAGTWIPRLLRNVASRWTRFTVENRAWSDITETDYYTTQLIAQGRGGESIGDDFTYTGDINTKTPTIKGGAWSSPAGVWVADGSGVAPTSSNSTRARSTAAATGDRRFITRLRFTADVADSGKFIALYPATTDNANELEIRITFGASGSPALALYTSIGGVFTQVGTNAPIASIAGPSATENAIDVLVKISGTTVTITANDTTVNYTLTSGAATAVAAMTGIGFRSTLTTMKIVSIRAVPAASANPLLTMLNNSKAGTTLSYQTGKLAMMFPLTPDVVLIGSSHNEAAQTSDAHTAEIQAFITAVKGYAPNAAVVLVGQNPRISPATNVTAHAARVKALREFARKNGYGYLPIYENFISRPDGGASYIDTDGIHPTGPASTSIGNLTTGYEFAAAKSAAFLQSKSKIVA